MYVLKIRQSFHFSWKQIPIKLDDHIVDFIDCTAESRINKIYIMYTVLCYVLCIWESGNYYRKLSCK